MLLKLKSLCIFASSLLLISCSSENVEKAQSESASIEKRPNILLIVADDLGYSDLGAFGGEISTPNLDTLASEGIRFTNAYAMPNCSPTRSILLTGYDNHVAGMGAMAEAIPTAFPFLKGRPGYEGYLRPETISVAEKLNEAGYRTMMTGKWHLGLEPELQPSHHGFEDSFVLLQGGGDHFGRGQNDDIALEDVNYTENGKPAVYPIGEYSSEFYTDKLIEYLKQDKNSEDPFFAYLAFTAPHWPLQAPKDLIAKYSGRYDQGPAVLLNQRLENLKVLGLIEESLHPEEMTLIQNWSSLSEEEKNIERRKMEIYAAMVDSMDQNVGKVINYLKDTNQLDNTVIVFMSDNGAEGINQQMLIQRSAGTMPEEYRAQVLKTIAENNVNLDKMGDVDSFLTYGKDWAAAAVGQATGFKGSTLEGGIRVPAFIMGPGVRKGQVVSSLVTARDIMPTLLDLAGIEYDPALTTPSISNERFNSPTAKSLVPLLNGASSSVRTEKDTMAWELHMQRAVRQAEWKAVFSKDGPSRSAPSSWKLFNLAEDPFEKNNLIDAHPDKFALLLDVWNAYAEENGVFVPGPNKTNKN